MLLAKLSGLFLQLSIEIKILETAADREEDIFIKWTNVCEKKEAKAAFGRDLGEEVSPERGGGERPTSQEGSWVFKGSLLLVRTCRKPSPLVVSNQLENDGAIPVLPTWRPTGPLIHVKFPTKQRKCKLGAVLWWPRENGPTRFAPELHMRF